MKVSIERIERAGFTAWSPEQTTTINGWTVSSNGGFTRRLNSATVDGSADTSLATRDSIRDWLLERGSPMTIRITPLVDPATVAACERNWALESVDETVVMTRRLGDAAEDRGVQFVDPNDDVFVSELFSLNGQSDVFYRQWNGIVERLGISATGIWIPSEAVGFVGVDDEVAPVFSVAVSPNVRRRGFATRIMDAASTWAVARGCQIMFLQVLGTNVAARRLYEKLGFDDAYSYRYLQAADGRHGIT